MSNWKEAAGTGTDLIRESLRLSDTSCLLFSAEDGIIYKSTDSGKTYTTKKTLSGETPSQTHIKSACHVYGDVYLCGTSPNAQIWRSTDAGDTWSMVKDIEDDTGETLVSGLTTINVNGTSSIVSAGTGPGAELWISSDAGATWAAAGTTTSISGESHIRCMCTVYEHATTGKALLGTYNNAEIHITADSGDTWTEEADIATEQYVETLCTMVQGATTGVILAGTIGTAEIWRSVDSGANWTRITNLSHATADCTGVYHIAKITENHAIACADDTVNSIGSLFESKDQGLTWTQTTNITVLDPAPPWYTILKLSDTLRVGGGNGGTAWYQNLDGAPGDALQYVVPDGTETLSLKPQDVIPYTVMRDQRVDVYDDGSEERISYSQKNYNFIDLVYRALSATNAGIVMDFWNSPDKGAGRSKTFLWTHPTDGYTYTVRIDNIASQRHLMSDHKNITIRLKLLGTYDI